MRRRISGGGANLQVSDVAEGFQLCRYHALALRNSHMTPPLAGGVFLFSAYGNPFADVLYFQYTRPVRDLF